MLLKIVSLLPQMKKPTTPPSPLWTDNKCRHLHALSGAGQIQKGAGKEGHGKRSNLEGAKLAQYE